MIGSIRPFPYGIVGSFEFDSIVAICGSGDPTDEIVIGSGEFRGIWDDWCIMTSRTTFFGQALHIEIVRFCGERMQGINSDHCVM